MGSQAPLLPKQQVKDEQDLLGAGWPLSPKHWSREKQKVICQRGRVRGRLEKGDWDHIPQSLPRLRPETNAVLLAQRAPGKDWKQAVVRAVLHFRRSWRLTLSAPTIPTPRPTALGTTVFLRHSGLKLPTVT